MLPLIILDFRVLVYKIYHTLEANKDKLSTYSEKQANGQALEVVFNQTLENVIVSNWHIILNRGVDFLDSFPHTLAVVDDHPTTKGYWRKDFFPEYKAGRPDKPREYNSITNLGIRILENPKSPYIYLRKERFEADDWAGALVYHKELHPDPTIQNRQVYLYTVDTDWLQLASDSVTWCDTGGYAPRKRTPKEAIEWTKRRLKVDITEPSEIALIKAIQGDKSDNLPPNTPLDLIDLRNPYYAHNLRYQVPTTLESALTSNYDSRRLDNLNKARDFLISNDLPIVY